MKKECGIEQRDILFTIYSLSGGGAERVVSVLANQFSRMGHNVTILLTHSAKIVYELDERIAVKSYAIEPVEIELSTAIVDENIDTMIKNIQQKKSIKKSLIGNQLIKKIVENRDEGRHVKWIHEQFLQHPGAICYSFLTGVNLLAVQASRGTSVKVIPSERNDPHTSCDAQPELKKRLERCFKFSHAVVFQTPDARDYFSEATQRKGVVIPNPVSPKLPKMFNGQRRKVIVNFCRLTVQKNIPLLLDAMAIVVKKYPEYRLEIIGQGELKNSIEKKIQEKGLNESVSLLPYRNNIHEYIRDCAMYVSSSDFEGISNSMIEAMAIGLPTVCTDCPIGGARMMIQNRINGMLVPCRNSKALADTMLYIIEHPEEAQKMAENASKIRKLCSVESIANMWLQAAK